MNRIAFVTTTRADYGIMSHLINYFRANNQDYEIIVSGIHLNQEYGYSYNEIIAENIAEVTKVDIKSGAVSIWEEIEKIYHLFPKVLNKIKPDTVVVLGDRYEIFHIANVCTIMKIPVTHLHGGEITEGALDDTFRHCITKMSYLHFVTSKTFKSRVLQLGESIDRVFNFGSLSVNFLVDKYSNTELGLNDYHSRKNIVFIYHPVTNGNDNIEIIEVIKYLIMLNKYKLHLFLPNNDPGRDEIYLKLREFKQLELIKNMKYSDYIDLLRSSFCIIGNSSSGMIEAPALRVPTINIGNRQKSRVNVDSIINCSDFNDVVKALVKIETDDFASKVLSMKIPSYCIGGTEEMYKKLLNFEFGCQKKFIDME